MLSVKCDGFTEILLKKKNEFSSSSLKTDVSYPPRQPE